MIARGCLYIALAPLPFMLLFGALSFLDSLFVPLALLFVLLQLFFLLFFRDPERQVDSGIVSPADGVVIEAGRHISVFMNLWNVHVNRAPLAGTIVAMQHMPGRHAPAFREKGDNERLHIELHTEHGDITVTQIAGTIARRIVPYLSTGEIIEKGQRIGIIRFGSKVTVELPDDASPAVETGDRVRAGQTIATMNEQ
ncbi:MAG: phosphatidylserine decarboxylase [Thermoplasmatota archaeon]